MTDAGSRQLCVAAALALALLVPPLAPLPAAAAGGGGGHGGGGMGGGHGGIFHVRGGGLRGDPAGPRLGGADPARGAGATAAPSRSVAGSFGRPSPRGFRDRDARRCDRTLYERYHAPHSCDTSRAYGPDD